MTSDKFQRHSFKVAFNLTAKSVRSHILTFGIFEYRIAGLGSCEDSIHFARSRSRSRSGRTVSLGAGAGAGAGAGMLPRSRSRSRSRPKMSRLRIPVCMYSGFRKSHCSIVLHCPVPNWPTSTGTTPFCGQFRR